METSATQTDFIDPKLGNFTVSLRKKAIQNVLTNLIVKLKNKQTTQ